MNRDLFKISSFASEALPAYPCPSCNTPLELSEADLDIDETADSKRDHADPNFDHEWVRYQFFAKLRCPSNRCSEVVHCIGTGHVSEDPEIDTYSGEIMGMEFRTYLHPQCFIPPINITQIPGGSSHDVAMRMHEAFSLFFSSHRATLNALRSALEFVLDDLGITRANEAGKRMSLHSRIEALDPVAHGLKREWLHALKVMGNAGTHGEEVAQRQVLDGFEVMEAVLAKVYEKHQVQRIDRIAAETLKRNTAV